MNMINSFLIGLGMLLSTPACTESATEQSSEEMQQPAQGMTAKQWNKDVPPHLFAAASDGEASSNINPAAMW